jgi:hypothetical protein
MSLSDLVNYYEDLADEAERQNREYNNLSKQRG